MQRKSWASIIPSGFATPSFFVALFCICISTAADLIILLNMAGIEYVMLENGLFLIVIYCILKVIGSYGLNYANFKLAGDLVRSIISKITVSNCQQVTNDDSNKLESLLTEKLNSYCSQYTHSIFIGLGQCLTILVIITMAFINAPEPSMFFVILPLFAVAIACFIYFARLVGGKHNVLLSSSALAKLDFFTHTKEILVGSGSDSYKEKIIDLEYARRAWQSVAASLAATPRLIFDLGLAVIVVYLAAGDSQGQEFDSGIGGFWSFAFVRFAGSGIGLIGSLTKIFASSHIRDDLNEFFYKLNKLNAPDFRSTLHSNDVREIVIKDVNFRNRGAGDLYAKPLSLTINKGEKVCMIGKSGSGKSTLLDCIAGFRSPDAGKIYVSDQATIGLSLQGKSRSIKDIKTFLWPGVWCEKITQKAYYYAEKLDLLEILDRQLDNPHTSESRLVISGGQYARIDLLRVALSDPSVVLLDETTSSLDPINKEKSISFITEVFCSKTVILVTHDQQFLSGFDRIIEM